MDVLPEYLVVESLGEVSGKSLYWARRKTDNAIVLVKQSRTMYLFDDEIEQFKQEYKIAQIVGYKVSLHLPNAQNGYGAIIYESCDGVFLNRLLETQQLSIDDKIDLFRIAAKALCELQKKRVMHFGIRLDRTLLHNNEEIIFFALGDTAILNDDEVYFPKSHHYPLEVLKYLPPELTGKTCKVADFRTSFYQLGIMFYRIFTGKFPFESSSPESLLYSQAFEIPVYPQLIKQEIPGKISAIIMKLLEKDPEDRYRTAQALCADLEENVNSEINFVPGVKDCGIFKLTRKLFGYGEQLDELNWFCKHISLAESRAVFIRCDKGCGKKEFLENFSETVNKVGGYYFNTDFSPMSGSFPYHGILILLNQIIACIKDNDKTTKFIDYLKKEKNIEPYLNRFATLFPQLKNVCSEKSEKEFENIHFRHSFFYFAAGVLRFFTENFGILSVYVSGLTTKMKEELKLLRYLLGNCSHLILLISISEESKEHFEKNLDSDNVFFAEIRLPVLSRTEASQMIAASFHCNTTQTLQAADVLVQQSGGRVGVMKYILQKWNEKRVLFYNSDGLQFDVDLSLQLFEPNFNVTESLLENKSSVSKSFLQLLSCFPVGAKGIKMKEILKMEKTAYQQCLNECKNFITKRNGYIYFQHDKDRYFIYKNLSDSELKFFHVLIILDFIQSGKSGDFSFTMMDHALIAFDSLNETQRDFLLDLFIKIIEKANLTAAFEYGFQLCCKLIDLYGNEILKRKKIECHFYCLATTHAFFSKNYEMMLNFFNYLNVDEYRNDYEKLKVQEIVAEYFYQVGQLDEGIELCKSALQCLGFAVSENISELKLLCEKHRLKRMIANLKNIEKLQDMKKNEHILVMRYLAKIIPIISFLRVRDAEFLACQMVSFVLEHGKCLVSPLAFALYAAFLVGERQNFKDGVFFAQTALAMLDDIDDTEFVSETIFFAVYFAGHWKLSHEQIYYWINKSASYDNDYGCSNFGVICNNILPLYSCFSGMHLKQICANSERNVVDFFNLDVGNPTAYLRRISLDVIKSLSVGGERMWTILSEIAKTPQSGKERFFAGYYYTLELFLSVMEEKTDIIQNKSVAEEKMFFPFFAEKYLYQALLLKLAITNGTVNKKSGVSQIRKILKLLKKYQNKGAENLETKFYMVFGMIAELNMDFVLSNKWYYEALQESLKKSNYLDAGLCSLLLMKQQLRNGDKIVAFVYYKKAIQFFNSLGYQGVISYLKTRYEIQLEDDIVLNDVQVVTSKNEIINSFAKELRLVNNTSDLIHYFIRQVSFLFQSDICLAICFDKNHKPMIGATEFKKYSAEINEGTMLAEISNEKIPKYLISFVCENACCVNLNDKKWYNIISFDRYLKERKQCNIFCIPLFESAEVNPDNIAMVLYLETSLQKQVFSMESEVLIHELFETYVACKNRLQLSLNKKIVHSKKVKYLEQRLKDVRSKYKELTYLQSQGLLKFDLHGKVTYCNSIGRKMLGLDTKTLKDGFFITQLFISEEDKANGCANVEKVVKYNFGGPYEYQWRNDCFVRVSWIGLKNKNGKIIGGRAIFINITKQKQNEEMLRELNERQEELIAKRTQSLNESLLQLRRSQNRLIQSEKMASLNSVIIGISHEINTPLGIAITSTSVLKDACHQFDDLVEKEDLSKEKLMQLSADTKNTLSMISNNLGSIASLINNFKELLREQSNSELCQFDLRYYINMVYQTQKSRFANIEHEFILNCPEPFLLNSYPGVFFQIFSNLMINSFIHGFEKCENCVIDICVNDEDKKQIEIVYKDTGRGIEEDNVDKIFNPFFTTKIGQGGQGLGLYIVYNLVHERLNGTIQCNSSLGKGTTFTITFPNVISREQLKNDNN